MAGKCDKKWQEKTWGNGRNVEDKMLGNNGGKIWQESAIKNGRKMVGNVEDKMLGNNGEKIWW